MDAMTDLLEAPDDEVFVVKDDTCGGEGHCFFASCADLNTTNQSHDTTNQKH
jgi:hypothetical protein